MAALISSSITACLKSFNEFIDEIRHLQDRDVRGLDPSAWEDELGRLRMWAANIDAQQTGRLSLDFRLRDASHVREQIIKLLQGLLRRLQDARDVLADDKGAAEDDVEDDTEDDDALNQEYQKPEIQELQESLTTNVDCLFQMSMLVRKPAQHDLYLESRWADIFGYAEHDRLAASRDRSEQPERLPAIPVADSAAIGTPESLYSESSNPEYWIGGHTYELQKVKHSEIIERVRLLGPEHTDTLRSMTELARLLSNPATYGEASHWERQVMEIKKRLLGTEHPETLESMMNLAKLAQAQKQSMDAEMIHWQELDGYEKVLGPDHTVTLSAVKELGDLYMEQGKLAEAEIRYLQVLNGYVKIFGPDHTMTLEKCNDLGGLYEKQINFAKAETMYERALTGYTKSLGPDHTMTLSTINKLGHLFEQQNKLAEAEAMYKRVLNGFRKTLGPNNPTTVAAAKKLRSFYSKGGKLEDAEAVHQRE